MADVVTPAGVVGLLLTADAGPAGCGNDRLMQSETRRQGVSDQTVTGHLGPDGAGKATLRLLRGLAEPSSSEALVFGRRYRELEQPIRSELTGGDTW